MNFTTFTPWTDGSGIGLGNGTNPQPVSGTVISSFTFDPIQDYRFGSASAQVEFIIDEDEIQRWIDGNNPGFALVMRAPHEGSLPDDKQWEAFAYMISSGTGNASARPRLVLHIGETPPAPPLSEISAVIEGDDVLVTWNSETGMEYSVLASSDMVGWSEIGRVAYQGDYTTYRDVNAMLLPRRYYKIVEAGYYQGPNMVQNGSFEMDFGLPFGLRQFLDITDTITPFGDPYIDSTTAASGSSSLVIDAPNGQKCELWVRSVIVQPGQLLTYAFSARSDNPSGVTVTGSIMKYGWDSSGLPTAPHSNSSLGSIGLSPLTTSWKRRSVNITVPASSSAVPEMVDFYITTTGTGPYKVWIDDITVREGVNASDFAPQGQLECIITDEPNDGIFYAGGTVAPTLNMHNYGPGNFTGSINYSIKNSYFDEYYSSSSIPVSSMAPGSSSQMLFLGLVPAGIYRMDIVVLNDVGETVSDFRYDFSVIHDVMALDGPVDFKFGAYIRERTFEMNSPPSPFKYEAFYRGGKSFDDYMKFYRQSGSTVMPISFLNHLSWRQVETSQGNFFWDKWDYISDAYGRNDVLMMPMMVATGWDSNPPELPQWLINICSTTSFNGHLNYLPPSDLYVENFFTAFTNRYENELYGFEAGGEMNMFMSAANFNNYYVEPEYSAVKAVNPAIKVGGPSTTSTAYASGDNWYFNDFVAAGGATNTDSLNSHPYIRPHVLSMSDWDMDYLKRYIDGVNTVYGSNIVPWETECFEYHLGFLGNNAVSWEVMQRLYSDVMNGCPISVPLLADEYYGMEISSYLTDNLATLIPNATHVAYNAAFYMLNDATLVNKVPLNKMVLAGLYQSPTQYTLVVMSANFAEKQTVMTITGDMTGAKLYDTFGRLRDTLSGSSNQIVLGRDPFYIQFPIADAQMIPFLEQAEITFEDKTPEIEKVLSGDFAFTYFFRDSVPNKTPVNEIGEYLRGWYLAGPIMNGNMSLPYIPETSSDTIDISQPISYGGNDYEWGWFETDRERDYAFGKGYAFNVNDYFLPETDDGDGTDGSQTFVAYCYREVEIPTAATYTIKFNCQHNGIRVWVNGVLKHSVGPPVGEYFMGGYDPWSWDVSLNEGTNIILIKIRKAVNSALFRMKIDQ